MTTSLLLLLALSTQIILAGSCLLWSDRSKQSRRLNARLHATPTPTASPSAAGISREATTQDSKIARFASVFGCDWNRRQLYPMQWWLVLAMTCGAGQIAYLGLSGIAGDVAVLAWPVAWVAGARMLFRGWDTTRREKLLEQFADVISTIVRTAAVGVPLVEAVRVIARESAEPTATEFRKLAEEIGIGLSIDSAVLSMAERTGMTEYRFFATTIVLQMQTGGGLTEALTNLAEVVRGRIALRARGYALSSEARTSAKVLICLPFVVGFGIMLLSPNYMDPLFHTDTGHQLLEVATGSLIMGWFVMRSLIRGALT